MNRGSHKGKTVRKKFQTHHKKSKIIKNTILNLSRLDSKKAKNKSRDGIVSNYAAPRKNKVIARTFHTIHIFKGKNDWASNLV